MTLNINAPILICLCRDASCEACHGKCTNFATYALANDLRPEVYNKPMCDGCAEDALNTGLFGIKALTTAMQDNDIIGARSLSVVPLHGESTSFYHVYDRLADEIVATKPSRAQADQYIFDTENAHR